MAFYSHGNLYVADFGNQRVQKLDVPSNDDHDALGKENGIWGEFTDTIRRQRYNLWLNLVTVRRPVVSFHRSEPG